MYTILLTGKNGQVGWELQRTLAPLGKIIAVDIDELDFTSPEKIRNFVRDIPQLSLIINPAAFTNVDGAEDASELAKKINTDAPAILAEESNRLGIPMIHYSTDYVFDGRKETPYLETDQTAPLGIYGQTKLDGERAVATINPNHLVLRLCWVYGTRGKNFFLTMLNLAKQNRIPKVVCDQIGSPTWSRMIAEATALIASQIILQPERNVWGTYHLAAGGVTNWHKFAVEIFRWANKEYGLTNVVPIAIPSSEYPVKAKRPAFSHLCTDKIAETFGIRLPEWQKQFEFVCGEGQGKDGRTDCTGT